MFETLELLDRNLLLRINELHTPFLDGMMWFLSKSWPTVVIIAVTALVFYRKYSMKKAVEFLLGCAIVFAATDPVDKHHKKRGKTLPPTHNLEIKSQVHIVNGYHGGKYGFFSGHAANTFL